jgi:CAAX protease family protein
MPRIPAAYRPAVWVAWLVGAFLLLPMAGGPLYGIVIPGSAAALALLAPPASAPEGRIDVRDLGAVLGIYAGVVGLFSLAFRYFTQERTAGLFVSFAAGLLLGVAGPVVYTVWMRTRPLADLGLSRTEWGRAVALGLVLAGVQFALTLYGYALPAPVDWVPLAALALVVGLFEAVFFRGFVQTRLAASFGTVPGVGAAAALYALYHVGYGMGAREMLFLFGLGVVYAVAYACTPNVLVLWPLLLPMGSFYNNLQGGEITMPWAAILGFVDVFGFMAAVIWLARRHERRSHPTQVPPPTGRPVPQPLVLSSGGARRA